MLLDRASTSVERWFLCVSVRSELGLWRTGDAINTTPQQCVRNGAGRVEPIIRTYVKYLPLDPQAKTVTTLDYSYTLTVV